MKEIGVGIIGLGVVGSGVYETLMRHSDEIARRTGIKLALRKVADLDESRRRELGVPDGIFTKNAEEIISDPAIDIVVELIGCSQNRGASWSVWPWKTESTCASRPAWPAAYRS